MDGLPTAMRVSELDRECMMVRYHCGQSGCPLGGEKNNPSPGVPGFALNNPLGERYRLIPSVRAFRFLIVEAMQNELLTGLFMTETQRNLFEPLRFFGPKTIPHCAPAHDGAFIARIEELTGAELMTKFMQPPAHAN